jgi:hypothetical protein
MRYSYRTRSSIPGRIKASRAQSCACTFLYIRRRDVPAKKKKHLIKVEQGLRIELDPCFLVALKRAERDFAGGAQWQGPVGELH